MKTVGETLQHQGTPINHVIDGGGRQIEKGEGKSDMSISCVRKAGSCAPCTQNTPACSGIPWITILLRALKNSGSRCTGISEGACARSTSMRHHSSTNSTPFSLK